MSLRPSSLPFMSLCALWRGDQETGAADKDAGTARHVGFRRLLSEAPIHALADIPEDERGSVEWAGEYVRTHAPTSEYQLRLEYHTNPLDAEFRPVFENGGTIDACCGPVLFDLKWQERDYEAQMAAYALGMMQEDGWSQVTAHMLFAKEQRIVTHKFTESRAEAMVNGIVQRVRAGGAPTLCEYCGWCANRATCPAINAAVEKVSQGYSDMDKVKSWHPSQMESGQDLGLALWLWRNVLKKWGESVEFHALEAAQKKGLSLDGFELKSKKGKTFVTDVGQAFQLAGLPQDEFLKGCQVRLNTSKTYPDQKGLVDLYAAFHGLKKAPAGRDLLKKLESATKTGADTVYLSAVKSSGSDE